VDFKRHTWEVDEFHGDNEGLVVAEIELDDENEIFEKPDWLDDEVTSDYRYLNSNLSKSSYKTW
jgi:CYTH domain-containing protein